MQDGLTRLWNQNYLYHIYNDYVINHENSVFIMIDLSSFKKINDSYGHEEGDKCLKIFARIMKYYFMGDLIFRLHGDEFAIITRKDEEEIFDIFECAYDKITEAAANGYVPLVFGFNAGSTKLEKNLKLTMDKADYMMYKAKKDGNKYQPYSNILYQEKIDNSMLLSDIKDHINEDNFSYYGRNLYNIDDKEEKMVQIYTKDGDGHKLFSESSYNVLRENSTISRFDKKNIEKFIKHINLMKSEYLYFVSIDYKSLFSIKSLTSLIKNIDKSLIEQVVISIDIEGIESSEYPLIIEIISLIKRMGFKVRLDKISNKLPYYFIEETEPSYVKIASQDWKIAYVDDHKSNILKNSVSLIKSINDNTRIIFEMIENKDERDYLHDISFDDTLFSGNYYSLEKKLTLK